MNQVRPQFSSILQLLLVLWQVAVPFFRLKGQLVWCNMENFFNPVEFFFFSREI